LETNNAGRFSGSEVPSGGVANSSLPKPPAFYRLKSRMYELALRGASLVGPGAVWPGKNGFSRLVEFDQRLAVVALLGYKIRWLCPECGGVSASMLRPELCGVVPWRWPWPYAEPDSVPTEGRGFIKVFFLSTAALRDARVFPAVCFTARVFPCRCGEGKQHSAYFLLFPRKGGEPEKRGVFLEKYLDACRRAADALPEVAAVRRVNSVERTKEDA